jgi:hypothetical protein
VKQAIVKSLKSFAVLLLVISVLEFSGILTNRGAINKKAAINQPRETKIHSALVASSLPSGCSYISTNMVSCTYSAGTSTTLNIPTSAIQITVSLNGAQGGGTSGGLGGSISGNITNPSSLINTVSSFTIPFTVTVGQQPSGNSAGVGGAGAGGSTTSGSGQGFAGGGGTYFSWNSSNGSVMLLAAGGGGGQGGTSGGLAGGSGGSGGQVAGYGSNGNSTTCPGGAGGAASSSGGGFGGSGGSNLCSVAGQNGAAGAAATGGSGGMAAAPAGTGGGGGGGGWYGGGGGGGGGSYGTSGGGSSGAGGGGGGGYSGYNTSYVSGTVFADGSVSGGGSATIQWQLATTTTNLKSANSTFGTFGTSNYYNFSGAYVNANVFLVTTVTYVSGIYASTGTLNVDLTSNQCVIVNGALSNCGTITPLCTNLTGGWQPNGSGSSVTNTMTYYCKFNPTSTFNGYLTMFYSGDNGTTQSGSSIPFSVQTDPVLLGFGTITGSNQNNNLSIPINLTAFSNPTGDTLTITASGLQQVNGVNVNNLSSTVCSQTITINSFTSASTYPFSCTYNNADIPGTNYTFTATTTPDVNNSAGQGTTSFSTITNESTQNTISVSPTPSTPLIYGNTVLATDTVAYNPAFPQGLSGGTVTFYYPGVGGSNPQPVVCSSTNPVNLAAGTSQVNQFQASCSFVPGVTSNNTMYASYSGDSTSGPSNSAQISFNGDVSPASSSTSLSVNPQNGQNYVGVPIVLKATVSNLSNSGIAPNGAVEFEQNVSGNYQPISGCSSVALIASNSQLAVASCAPSTPTNTSTLNYEAIYCPTGSGGNCSNWTSSQATSSYTPSPDPTQVTLSPTSSEVHPIQINANTAVTVTATVSDIAGSAQPSGLVTFYENGSVITNNNNQACSGLSLTNLSPTSGTASCTFVPPFGTSVSVSVTYNSGSGATDPNTSASTSSNSPLYFLVGGAPTATVVSFSAGGNSITSAYYGQPVNLIANVTAPGTGVTVNEGTVSFMESGQPIVINGSVVCQNVNVSNGQAICPTAVGLPAGSSSIAASYADASATFGASNSASTITINPSPTTLTLSLSPDPNNLSDSDLIATVSNANSSYIYVPSGGVSFTTSCLSQSTQSNSVSLISTCIIPTPGANQSFTATYVPANTSQFSQSSSAYTTPSSTSCSSTFSQIWSDAYNGSSVNFSISVGSVGQIGSLNASFLAPSSSTCDSLGYVNINSASLNVFSQTITASSVSGYVEDQSGSSSSVTLCLNSGVISLPSNWKLGATLSLSTTQPLCFDIGNNSVTTNLGTLTNFSSVTLAFPLASLPFGIPDASVSYGINLSLGINSGDPFLTVGLVPISATGSSPYVNAQITVTYANSALTANGTLLVGNLLAGGPITVNLSVTAGASGSIAASVTLPTIAPASSPISPVPGLILENIVITLSSTSGMTLTATAILGSSSSPVTVGLAGGYSAGTWSLNLTSTPINWTPFSSASLSFSVSLSGSVIITNSGDFTFDFEASAPSGSSIATWNPVTGVVLTANCLAISYGTIPTCGASVASGQPTPIHPTLTLEASVSIGGASGITVAVVGDIDLKTGASLFTLNSTGPVTLNVTSGLTLVLNQLTISGGISSPLSISGAGDIQMSTLSSSPIAVNVNYQSGSLIISASNIDLSGLGIPATGFFAYASVAVSGYNTNMSAIGSVNLLQGFNAIALFSPPAAVVSVLSSAGFNLSASGVIEFIASWAPGTSPTFKAQLNAPSGFPFLTLPNGATVSSVVLSYASSTLSLDASGTFPVPNNPSAGVSLSVSISSDGSFSGSGSVTGLVIFGQTVNLSGTVSKTATGSIQANITTCNVNTSGTCVPGALPGPFSPFAGINVTFTNVLISLGTSGLNVSGNVSVEGLFNLTFSGSFNNLSNWAIAISETNPQTYNPIAGVSINANFAGSLSDSAGVITYDIQASGNPLFGINTSGVSVNINSVELSNGNPASGCVGIKVGDIWIALNGDMALNLGSINGSTTVSGCIDLTSGAFGLSAAINSLAMSLLGGHVDLSAPTVNISDSQGTFSANITANLTVYMPSGGSITLAAILDVTSSGFVVGAEANLSSFLGSTGAVAYMYYASAAINGVNTGDPSLGSIELQPGLTIAVAIQIPESWAQAVSMVGLNIPVGTNLAALANLNFAQGIYTFKVSISFGSGITLFSINGSSLVLNDGYLYMQISSGQVTFGVGLTATLNIAPAVSGYAGSSVQMTGQISATFTNGTPNLTISLALGNCESGATTGGWDNAFGINGLSVQCAALQVGVNDIFPFITGGLEGTITALPSYISNVTGYQNGAPITFAFNLDPFLLDLTFGTKNSNQVVMAPLTYFGLGSDLQVYYANLYISPQGATIAQTVYPPGFSLGFQGSIFGAYVSVLADISFSPVSFSFSASLSQVTIGSLSIGPVGLSLDINPSQNVFDFEFNGTLSLGPGGTQIGPALQVSGSMNASVQIQVSTSGISAYISGNLSATVAVYVPTNVCFWKGFIPYPCDYQWKGTSFSIDVPRTGFSVNSSGVTLEAVGYSITFGFNGSVSVSKSSYTPGEDPYQISEAIYGQLQSPNAVLAAYITQNNGKYKEFYLTKSPPARLMSTQSGSGNVSVSPVGGSTVVGTWQNVSALSTPRANASSVLLSNGNVLIAGGLDDTTVLNSSEIFNYKTGSFTPAASMNVAREGAGAVLLSNGDVLVAGGLGSDDQPESSAEIYNPINNTWTQVGSLTTPRAFFSIAALPGGNAIVFGGQTNNEALISTCEIYDFSTGTWRAGPSLPAQTAFYAATKLANGNIFIAGGITPKGPTKNTEIYNISSSTFEPGPKLIQAMYFASSTLMPDGNVLVIGGQAFGEIYNPFKNSVRETSGMLAPVSQAGIVSLPNGDVLVVGGTNGESSTAQSQLYLANKNEWVSAGKLSQPVSDSQAVVLPNGEVLAAGGFNLTQGVSRSNAASVSNAEIYSWKNATEAAVNQPVRRPLGANVIAPKSYIWLFVILAFLLLAIILITALLRRRRA